MTTILNFRLIRDDSLNLNDRVIYSLAWKYNYGNTRRLKDKRPALPITVRRLMRFTGYRSQIITASLTKLHELGYLTDKHEIVPNRPTVLGYRKLELNTFTDKARKHFRFLYGLHLEIFMMLYGNGTETHRANWWCKVLGVSRKTYFRWRRWLLKFEDVVIWHCDGEEVRDPDVEDAQLAELDARVKALDADGFQPCW